jgi:putative nucleotidyltransferase with HDIG domain
MTRASAQDLIQETVTLPTLPQVVARINALVDDPEVGTREIGEAVSEDAPIAAKVLKIANSAYYGLRETVLSTEHASAVLGVRQLRNIAMQASVISQFDHLEGSEQFDIDQLWRHSILTGQACAELSRRCRARIGLAPDEFHVIGLLHDMGKVLLLESMGDRYLVAAAKAAESAREGYVCEEEVLGFNHAHVGALIAAQWGLPASIVNAIQFHHGPTEEAVKDPVANLLFHTNHLTHAVTSQDLDGAAAAFDAGTMRTLGLRPTDVEECVSLAAELLPQIEL